MPFAVSSNYYDLRLVRLGASNVLRVLKSVVYFVVSEDKVIRVPGKQQLGATTSSKMVEGFVSQPHAPQKKLSIRWMHPAQSWMHILNFIS